jgi:UPF0755 protein
MKKLLTFLTILAFLGIVFSIGLFWYGFQLIKPVDSTQKQTVSFVIPKGQAVAVVANRLEEEELIRSALAFRIAAKLNGFESAIQSGSFNISPAMTPSQIGQTLTSGSEDVWITLLEGWRTEEIAQSIAAQEELSLFDEDEFLSLAVSSEGRLYPDSYLVPKEFTAQQIYSLLTNTFQTKVLDGLEKEIAASDRDFEDVLVMASIVEREGRGYEQMRQVAGILWNRVDIGMALQADATLQYIAGYNTATQGWWSPPNVAVKSIESPFNTYLNPGLPPRPIANPSYEAIRATLNPAESDYLFYIHDGQGVMHYATILDEHNRNIDRYLR